MIIKEVQINGFGKFEGTTINLNSGINLIKSNNETGKSSLVKFIKGMFYRNK